MTASCALILPAVLCQFVTVLVRKISAVIGAVRFFAPHSTNDSTFRTILQYSGFQLGVRTTSSLRCPKEVTGSEIVGSIC
jgi:hypothetical protein